MIWHAARSAFIANGGSEALIVNHAYSARCWPLNVALRGLPVRISPGHTVVTQMPSLAISARRPSENPVRANLLAEYGSRCGTAILPPIDEMLTMRPLLRERICGSTASVAW